MKKLGILSVAFVLALSLSSVASAAIYGLNDTIDYLGSDGVWGKFIIPDYLGTFDYQQDAMDRDFSRIQFDNSCWQFCNGGNTNYEFLFGMNWHGPRHGHGHGHGHGPGCGSPAPVPEPSTMILLGMGLFGMAVPGIKKIYKKK